MILADPLSPPHVFRLVCRPALPKDKPDVVELTRTVWEGHDYIPQVWDEWMRDEEGLLAVGEFGGRVVGTIKLSRLAPDEWWLEGLRVHPDYEGRGFASHLHDYIMDFWQRRGGGTLRLVTGSFRQSVHHLCERTGFQKTGEFTVFAANSVSSSDELWGGFTSLHRGEEHAALDFVQDLEVRLMDLGWQWISPSLNSLGEAIYQGQAWWWRPKSSGRQALLTARIDNDDEAGDALAVSLLACPPADLTACLHDFRWLAGAMGLSRAVWFAPLGAGLEAFLDQAGYRREWDDALFLFEKEEKP